MSKIENQKNTNTSAGIGTTPEGMVQKDVLTNNIAHPTFNVFGSPDDELNQLAQEPLFKMYAEVGPEIYSIIARCNPTLKAVIDLAKEICEGGQ